MIPAIRGWMDRIKTLSHLLKLIFILMHSVFTLSIIPFKLNLCLIKDDHFKDKRLVSMNFISSIEAKSNFIEGETHLKYIKNPYLLKIRRISIKLEYVFLIVLGRNTKYRV